MNEELRKRAMEMLEQLAAALGTTVVRLWEVLVAQAQVEGVLAVVGALLSLGLVGAALYVVKWGLKNPDDDGWVLIPTTPMLIAGCICFWLNLKVAVTAWLNPEYWALQEILKLTG